jgi:DNA-binding CsgD family transcriptional regulator
MKPVLTAWDVLTILEAVYDIEQSREEWLTGVLKKLLSAAGRGEGVGGVLYDVSREGCIEVEGIHAIDVQAGWLDRGLAMHQDANLAPHISAGYRSLLCATLWDFDERAHGRLRQEYSQHRVAGQIMINGIDCSGKGCALYVFSRAAVTLSPPERDLFSRMATHLATGYRLQRQLQDGGPGSSVEAVLTPDGSIEHVEAPAESTVAREALQSAVRQRERRLQLAALDPMRAVRQARGLVEARWTLVDRCEPGEPRAVLARQNAPAPSGPVPLSGRERQVVALATLGRSNKMIAYELGLAHSTVRVLMARAAVKLHAPTRRALVAQQRSIEAR